MEGLWTVPHLTGLWTAVANAPVAHGLTTSPLENRRRFPTAAWKAGPSATFPHCPQPLRLSDRTHAKITKGRDPE